MAKTELLTLRISPEVKALAAQRAAALGLSASEYVRMLILEDVRRAQD